MNPFFQRKSPAGVSITCTNLRGMGITVEDLADKKINRILNLTADIHILLDTRCTEAQIDQFLSTSKFKYLLSNFEKIGTYTKSKGIIILYNKKKIKIEDLSIIQEGMLISFRLVVQNEEIRILGCYAPSSGDDPEFFHQCKEILDQSTETLSLIHI